MESQNINIILLLVMTVVVAFSLVGTNVGSFITGYYGANTTPGTVNITIGAVIELELNQSTVDFGTITQPTSYTVYNTTNCTAGVCTISQTGGASKNITPFVLENSGTSWANTSINSTQNASEFLCAGTCTDNTFEFLVEENYTQYDNNTGSCFTNKAENWTNITNSLIIGCEHMRPTITNDSRVEYHIQVGVNASTTAGPLNTTITFRGVVVQKP